MLAHVIFFEDNLEQGSDIIISLNQIAMNAILLSLKLRTRVGPCLAQPTESDVCPRAVPGGGGGYRTGP